MGSERQVWPRHHPRQRHVDWTGASLPVSQRHREAEETVGTRVVRWAGVEAEQPSWGTRLPWPHHP